MSHVPGELFLHTQPMGWPVSLVTGRGRAPRTRTTAGRGGREVRLTSTEEAKAEKCREKEVLSDRDGKKWNLLRQPVQAQKQRRDITSHLEKSWQYRGVFHLPLLVLICSFSIKHCGEVYKNKTDYIINTINLHTHIRVSVLYVCFSPYDSVCFLL